MIYIYLFYLNFGNKNISLKLFFIIAYSLIFINNINNSININNNVSKNYKNLVFYFNVSFNFHFYDKIRIGIYEESLKNGGRERSTSLLLNYLNEARLFDLHLFAKKKLANEYKIPDNIKRSTIISTKLIDLIRMSKKKKIDILIYQFTKFKAIEKLNSIKNLKIIFYIHQCSLYWMNRNYNNFKLIYKSYQSSKYVITLLPFVNE